MKMDEQVSGFAVEGVGGNLTMDDEGTCQSASIGITGVSSKAYRPSTVESALTGAKLDEQTILSAAAHAADGVEANGDLFASADYRKHLAEVYARRAIAAAADRAK